MTTIKYPKTLSGQIKHLRDKKKVVFNVINGKLAENYLLRYNYINLISPFKYNYCELSENDINVPKKVDGKHIYSKETEFSEYLNRYEEERKSYYKLYRSISVFETHLKSIMTYEIFVTYNIIDEQSFIDFFKQIKVNCYRFPDREQVMLKDFDDIIKDVYRIKNYFNYFDRLSLKSYSNIFHCLDYDIRGRVFDSLKFFDQSLGVPSMNQFLERLFALVSIRNCVMHSNSMTILIRYFKTETNELRTVSDKKKFMHLVNYLIEKSDI